MDVAPANSREKCSKAIKSGKGLNVIDHLKVCVGEEWDLEDDSKAKVFCDKVLRLQDVVNVASPGTAGGI